MTETLFWFGWLAVAGGFTLGWYRMLDLLALAATAGAAALAVHAAQGFGLIDAGAIGHASRDAVALEALIYVEMVVLATLGWGLGRWQQTRAAERES